MKIEKIDTPDFKGVILDSNNYEDKINHIEISQARSKQKDDFLTYEEQSAMRSEIGKLTWLARIARPGAIYDSPAATRNFANFKLAGCDGVSFKENEGRGTNADKHKPIDSEHIPGFKNFAEKKSKTHFAVDNLIF